MALSSKPERIVVTAPGSFYFRGNVCGEDAGMARTIGARVCVQQVEYIPFRSWKGTGSTRDIRLHRRIINGATPDGFDIHRITRPMSTMIGAIEVSADDERVFSDQLDLLVQATHWRWAISTTTIIKVTCVRRRFLENIRAVQSWWLASRSYTTIVERWKS